ncbi:MAG: hypothetical protein VR74_16360 [Hyphomonas sp. BRH_c22]|uniref:ArnT family glycosyltransferase n=1 Tax=Hyphomonas sp. BRH_c22 TaxID=1629710 RepID=UPI0005F14F27|nr:glycosyltransferase family 39 protein [Hyphomonas sp. BRH_c22]KJS35538.1 MAG: hypothetical protein VR74_16360 [Hyphomonas sp. BRH_c22]
MAGLSRESESLYLRATLAGLGLLLLLRVGFLAVAPLNLYADEAQYWRWGETLDWGYYSKPPMIAWVIHAVTSVFGNDEWAVRLAAPFLHTIGALFIFLLGRAMYGARTGMMAAFGYALMPAVILSSVVISTDGVLMPFWCAGLFAFWRLRSGEGGWASAAALGVALGAGFLSKYAMVYFLIGMGLTLLLDRDTRKALLSRHGLVALLVAGAIFAPHMAWNAANDFKTVSHTVDNANLGGDLFHPEHALEFLVDQMGVFGPISLISLVFGLFVMRRSEAGLMGRDRWLLCFVVPVLVIILVQAVLSRANANWAATAWPAASVLVAAWLIRAQPNRSLWFWIAGLTFVAILATPDLALWLRLLIGGVIAGAMMFYGRLHAYRPAGLLWTSLAAHALIAVFFTTMTLIPAHISTELGFDNAQKRTRGWETAAAEVFRQARELGATSVLVDEREVWHGLDYYARGRDLPLLSWRRYGVPKSFSESAPLEPPLDETVLVVSLHPAMRPMLRSDFTTFESVGEIEIPLGTRRNGCPITRQFHLYLASGFAPERHDAAWEARHKGQSEFPAQPCPLLTGQ